METQQRLYYLDNVCGIMIFQVILGHQVGMLGYHNAACDFIYKTLSFFMFWFFFKGGMMFRNKNVIETIKKSAKRLLVPYLVFMLLGLICEAYFESLGKAPLSIPVFLYYKFWYIVNHSYLESVVPCWFLLSLFIVRVVFQMCIKIRIPPVIVVFVSLVTAYFVYFCTYQSDCSYLLHWGNGHSWDLHIPFYLGNVSLGLMCYSLGYILREKQYSKCFFGGAVVLFVIKYFVWADFDFRADDSLKYNYFLAVLYGVSGCVLFNNLFRQIANVRIPVLTHIGENSVIYYLVHYPVLYFITQRFYGTVFNLSPEIRFVIFSLFLIIVLWISGIVFRNKRISFLFGA